MHFKIHSVIPCIYKRGRGEKGRGAKVLHTYRHTNRPSDEAGPRGAFAPNKEEGGGRFGIFCCHIRQDFCSGIPDPTLCKLDKPTLPIMRLQKLVSLKQHLSTVKWSNYRIFFKVYRAVLHHILK